MPRPGGLAAHVQDVRPLPLHLFGPGQGGGGVQVPAAVGEGIGGDVQNAHHIGAGEGEALPPGEKCLHPYLPPSRAMTSARVLASLRMQPRRAEVWVRAPAARAPRMVMHRCSAWINTATPKGSSFS